MIEDVRRERDTLAERLEKGSRQIEQERESGEDVSRWEEFWIKLLAQYEATCDRLAAAEAGRKPNPAARECRTCGRAVVWARSDTTGKPAPIDAEPNPDGNIVLLPRGKYAVLAGEERAQNTADLHTNHFVTCPQAKMWAQKGRA